jgi:hypothetical protein
LDELIDGAGVGDVVEGEAQEFDVDGGVVAVVVPVVAGPDGPAGARGGDVGYELDGADAVGARGEGCVAECAEVAVDDFAGESGGDDEDALAGDGVEGSSLSECGDEEPAPDEVLADEDEGDSPERQEGMDCGGRRIKVVEVVGDAPLPEEGEAAPEEAEWDGLDVGWVEDDALQGLTGPEQGFAGEQLGLDLGREAGIGVDGVGCHLFFAGRLPEW